MSNLPSFAKTLDFVSMSILYLGLTSSASDLCTRADP
jgi:hypothetical protein